MPWDIWLIFFILGVILPWRGRVRLKKLLAMPHVGTMERLVLYASTIAFQWLAVALVAWRAWAHRFTPAELGLSLEAKTAIIAAGVIGAAAFATLQWLNLRRMRKVPMQTRGFLQAFAERVLPQSAVELLPYLALAITAGLCEEFLYRGFAMTALTRAGFPAWMNILFSSVLFALAHLYQGRGGLVSTMIIGLVFGTGRIAYGSLVPAILWHTAVDVVAGVAGPRYLVRQAAAPAEVSS